MSKSNIYAEITMLIKENMSQGVMPWEAPWLESGIVMQLPKNAHSGKPYSGVNVWMLLASQHKYHYSNAIWVSYKQAKSLGGNVRKGEKGTRILFFSTFEREQDDGNKETIRFAKSFSVFNLDQYDGLDHLKPTPPKPAESNSIERIASIDQIIEATRATIRHDATEKAYYRPSTDTIHIPPLDAFKSIEAYYSTVFHELGHWTGTKDRLERGLLNKFGSEAYAFEELVAELCAAYLCAENGLVYSTQHTAYINNWLKVLNGDDRAFAKAAALAQKAANYIKLC